MRSRDNGHRPVRGGSDQPAATGEGSEIVTPSAHDLYHRFVEIIDKAVAEKDIHSVPAAAIDAAMQGGEEQRGMGQRWNYSLRDSAGFTVRVYARWWDQSQAFSIRPDMHVMGVELAHNANLIKHEQRYEE
jgi:hypothetical protein